MTVASLTAPSLGWQAARELAAQSSPRNLSTENGPPPQTGVTPDAREAAQDQSKASGIDKNGQPKECQACKNRRYQDGSNDPGVSFKTPSKVDPKSAASVVRGHEMEHVFREQFKAAQEGRRVVYQNVTLHSDICGECGKSYISGGTTRTVTKGKQEGELFRVGLPEQNNPGESLSASA